MNIKNTEELLSLTSEQLDAEFERVVQMRDLAQDGLEAIRAEKARRLDEELARLREEMKARGRDA